MSAPLSPQTLLLAHAASTVYMTGLIWCVQVVHYPLFARVGDAGYAAYQTAHMQRITWIVLPPMLLELTTAAALVVWRPPSVDATQAWIGAALVGVIWASTALLQVPAHARLERGFDPAAHRWLVGTNWIRTLAWTARAALALSWLARYSSD